MALNGPRQFDGCNEKVCPVGCPENLIIRETLLSRRKNNGCPFHILATFRCISRKLLYKTMASSKMQIKGVGSPLEGKVQKSSEPILANIVYKSVSPNMMPITAT